MCGICGVLRTNPSAEVDRGRLTNMCAQLRHRGPDDEGVYVSGRAGLGVTRLAIIDVDGGHQPVSNETGRVWAVQNGEIYNYRLLRAQLQAGGHRFVTRSDTEVLVHLYEEYGPAFVERLRGMFALAVWDEDRHRLVLARDRIGVKPLFYALTAEELLFASEIPALLTTGLDRRVDPVALHDYLSFDFVPGPRTMLLSTRKLQPGHLLTYDGELEVRRYWDLPPQAQTPAPANAPQAGTDADLAGALQRRLEDAVKAHLVSDVPVGAFLSGGLDSSLVVALMSRLSGAPVATFSIGFRERSYDELPHARAVAELFGTDHHEYVVQPHIHDVLDSLVAAFGEPFADSSAVASYYLAREAAAETKVVLSGDGGDEVFGGYVIYQADRLARFYRWLPALVGDRLIPALARRLPASEGKMSWDLKIQRFVQNARRDPLAAHVGWRSIFSEDMKRQLYADGQTDASSTATDEPPVRDSVELMRRYFNRYAGDDLLNRLMYVDMKVSLADDMLAKVDRTSMAHGLEVRVPLLDHQLVEWMSRLPSTYKVHGLRLKHLLKQVARELLPPAIVDRPKAGFHVPIPAWLKGELRPLVEQQLSPAAVERQGVFDPRFVQSLLQAHQAGRQNYSRNIWGLLMFSLRYDRYVSGP